MLRSLPELVITKLEEWGTNDGLLTLQRPLRSWPEHFQAGIPKIMRGYSSCLEETVISRPSLSRSNASCLSVADTIALLALDAFRDGTIVRHVIRTATSVALPFHHRPSLLFVVT